MKTSITILLLCISVLGYSQQLGYKTIQIGVNAFDSTIKMHYIAELQSSDSVILFHCKQNQYICDDQVDGVAVVINKDSIITKVELYTTSEIYRDSDHFLEKFKEFSECIVSTVGKADDFDTGKEREDGRMRAIWLFPESKSMLIMYAYDVSISDRNAKRYFRLVWAAYNFGEPRRMWKIVF